MHHIMIAGAGKIGSLIACLLADTEDYKVFLVDKCLEGADLKSVLMACPEIKTEILDVQDQQAMQEFIKNNQISALISSLPYYLNIRVAEVAKQTRIHYFDLTEDTNVTKTIKTLALGAETAFVPQCGLAPGFVNVVANHFIQEFDECHTAQLRVGALPQSSNRPLHYALTWSIDGLLNQYANLCNGIKNGVETLSPALHDIESIQIDGNEYEAFNTSGGVGSLGELYAGKILNLNYKTIRYPGHCEKMRFLMEDLKLNEDRATLKTILERVVPRTFQDVVLIYVSALGMKSGTLTEMSYFKKIYPRVFKDLSWSAIQVTTASSCCAVLDLVMQHVHEFSGFVYQEQFKLAEVENNRFVQWGWQ